MSFKAGDKVLCIREKDIPTFVGTVWVVVRFEEDIDLIYCQNRELFYNKIIPSKEDLFPFRKNEIVLVTPLIEELL